MVDLPEARTSSIPWDGEDTDPTVAVAIDIGTCRASALFIHYQLSISLSFPSLSLAPRRLPGEGGVS